MPWCDTEHTNKKVGSEPPPPTHLTYCTLSVDLDNTHYRRLMIVHIDCLKKKKKKIYIYIWHQGSGTASQLILVILVVCYERKNPGKVYKFIL